MVTSDKISRYLFIDVVRGIAASSVFVQHSLEVSHIEVLKQGNFGLSWLNLGEVGVVAFFLVSGFVIPLSLEKSRSVSAFWTNRAFRIYPLYVSVYFVTFGMAVFWGSPVANVPINFVLHLLFVQDYVGANDYVAGSWTLSLEACWYLGFTSLFLASLHKRCVPLVLMAVLASLLACALTFGIVRLPMGRVSLLVVCMLGLLSYRYEQGDGGKRMLALGALTLAATVYINLMVGFMLRHSASSAAPSFRCVLISWTLGGVIFFVPFAFRKSPVWNNGLLLYLGKISYSVYLVHPIILSAVSRTALTGLPLVGVAALLTFAISVLTYSYIERPAIRFSHKVWQGHASVGAGRV